MRLINVNTLEMHDFVGTVGSKKPEYAILSHCWGENELLYQDFSQIRNHERTSGAEKILFFCRAVREMNDDLENRGFLQEWSEFPVQWVWVDTCCIDKSSSAELSEAINSMFKWYSECAYCVAYLSDVPSSAADEETLESFKVSRWFSRGWCLQELLAPSEILFYNKDWQCFGSKDGLKTAIQDITGIELLYLKGPWNLGFASVAQRMSWASKRQTTRLEDIAYCLLGIFNVNMPLLYGEGQKAFLRLQQEIINTSSDESIFAWTDRNVDSRTQYPILADHPRAFARSGNVHRIAPHISTAYTMTNRGLRYEGLICLLQDFFVNSGSLLIVQLACAQGDLVAQDENHNADSGRTTPSVPCMLAFRRQREGSYSRTHAGDLDLRMLYDRIMAPTSDPWNPRWKMSVSRTTVIVDTGMDENVDASMRRLEEIVRPVGDRGGDLWHHLFAR